MPPFPTSNMSGSERMVYMQIEIKIHTHKWRLVALPPVKCLCQDHILTIPSTRTSIGSPLVIKISNGSHSKQKTEERLSSILLKSSRKCMWMKLKSSHKKKVDFFFFFKYLILARSFLKIGHSSLINLTVK